MHKRAVDCELCNQKFFPSSLPFHMKACQKKFELIREECIYCKKQVKKIDYKMHLSKCRSQPQQKLQVQSNNNCNMKSQQQFDQEQENEGNCIGLVKCQVCLRFFSINRINYHYNICKKSFNHKNGQPVKRRIFDSKKQRLAELEMINPTQASKSKYQKNQITNSKQVKGNWKQQHLQFQQAMRANRRVQNHLLSNHLGFLNDSQQKQNSIALLGNEDYDRQSCKYCCRKFNNDILIKHQKRCCNIKIQVEPLKQKQEISGNIQKYRQKQELVAISKSQQQQKVNYNIKERPYQANGSSNGNIKIMQSNATSINNPLCTSYLQTLSYDKKQLHK